MSDELFEYEIMVERALRGVVRQSLEQVREHGLVGDHHFFITFHTDFPGVEMPEYLAEKYPEEMTIVLQYQFETLLIDDEKFEVTLSFNNIPERMVVPFEAITGFADPSVKFGLQFHVSMSELDDIEIQDLEEFLEEGGIDITEIDPEEELKKAPKKPAKKTGKKAGKKSEDGKDDDGDNIVSLDHFRKN